jgi:hypothetical protein
VFVGAAFVGAEPADELCAAEATGFGIGFPGTVLSGTELTGAPGAANGTWPAGADGALPGRAV